MSFYRGHSILIIITLGGKKPLTFSAKGKSHWLRCSIYQHRPSNKVHKQTRNYKQSCNDEYLFSAKFTCKTKSINSTLHDCPNPPFPKKTYSAQKNNNFSSLHRNGIKYAIVDHHIKEHVHEKITEMFDTIQPELSNNQLQTA